MTDRTRTIKDGRTLATVLATLALLVGLGACGGGSSPTALPGDGSDGSGGSSESDGGGTVSITGNSTGVLEISMKDAPIDDVSELWVYITGLKVKPAGGPVERLDTNSGLYDLLLLTDGVTELLVATEVGAGTYQFIEILLDEGQSYVVDRTTLEALPLKIASQKVKLKGGPFEVLEDGTTSVLFDFDAEKSLKRKGNGDWMLKPFLSIVRVVEDGDDGLDSGL